MWASTATAPTRRGGRSTLPRPAPCNPRRAGATMTPEPAARCGRGVAWRGGAERGGEAPSSCVLLLCSMSPSSVCPPRGAPRGPIFTDEEQPVPAGRGRQGGCVGAVLVCRRREAGPAQGHCVSGTRRPSRQHAAAAKVRVWWCGTAWLPWPRVGPPPLPLTVILFCVDV